MGVVFRSQPFFSHPDKVSELYSCGEMRLFLFLLSAAIQYRSSDFVRSAAVHFLRAPAARLTDAVSSAHNTTSGGARMTADDPESGRVTERVVSQLVFYRRGE